MRSPAHFAKRVALWALGLGLVLFFYGLGKLQALGAPRLLPMTAIDRALPFIPETVWLYGTITWTSLACWLHVPDRRSAKRLLFAILLSCAVCAAFFVLWPTVFPRELYPLPPDLGGATLRELVSLREADSPTNCFPSLHVALAWSIGLTWHGWIARRGWARSARPLPILWAAIVSVCTITTKQHYFVDVPAGMAVGALAWWAAKRLAGDAERASILSRRPDLMPVRAALRTRISRLRKTVEGHQWSLDEVAWPEGPLPPLDPVLVRLINELIYIEEIAGMNFALLARASEDPDLRRLYQLFDDEERRHAEGLRRVLGLHGAPIRPPGLGNSLVLDEFEALDCTADSDVYLVAVSNPVFETMLDAGTVPFLRNHPALKSAWFDDFVTRITRDEAAHLLVNWTVIRDAAARFGGWRGMRMLVNASVIRGMIAVPFMSLDVYSLAHRLGYVFRTLMPAFSKLWRLHRRYPELGRFPLWWVFRLFVACGVIATLVADWLERWNLIFIRFWTTFTRVTDAFAWLAFGRRLLQKRGLPLPGRLPARESAEDTAMVLDGRRPPKRRQAGMARSRAALIGSAWLLCAAAAHEEVRPPGALRGEAHPGRALWALTYNVNFERPDRRTAAAIAAAGADVVVLEETTPAWEPLLRQELGALYSTMMFRHAPAEGGMAVLSHFPVRERRWVPSRVGGFASWCLEVSSPLGELDVLGVHLHPPLDEGSLLVGFFTTGDKRLAEIEDYLGCFDRLPDLALGDFNENNGAAVRRLHELGLSEAQSAFPPVERTWSWQTAIDELSGRPDHAFVGARFRPVAVQVMEAGASDHRPLRFAIARADGGGEP